MGNNAFDEGLANGLIYDDPYAIYQILRNTTPICWSETKQAWIVTRYNDIIKGLADNRITARRRSVQMDAMPPAYRDAVVRFFNGWLMYQDPPKHSVLRRHARAIFMPSAINRVLHDLRNDATAVVGNYSDTGHLDIVHDYSGPIAVGGVCGLVGIPTHDWAAILSWSKSIVDFMQGRCPDLETGAREAKVAIDELRGYLHTLMQDQYHDSESPLHTFLHSSSREPQISEHEAASIVANILVDGHEPIANAVANAVLALAKWPEELRALAYESGLSHTAIDEFLRFDPPFQYVVRHARQDVTLGATHIHKGQRILFMIASANHDPEVFADPERLILSRRNYHHRAFGFGHHFCIGSPLARPLMRMMLEVLVHRIPQFTSTNETPARHQSLGSRALMSLHITW